MKNEQGKQKIITTADGSHTLFMPLIEESYHSTNGAVQESKHVFIDAGLLALKEKNIQLVEIGFGTGLNTLLTLLKTIKGDVGNIYYYSIELYPLEKSITDSLNYGKIICPEREHLFHSLHHADWDKPVKITDSFILHKIKGDSNNCYLPNNINLIYFDAFSPEKQPEMWNVDIFQRLYNHAVPGAKIVTYCAKGEVRRTMQAVGFSMERLPGPPGKRHMLRGTK